MVDFRHLTVPGTVLITSKKNRCFSMDSNRSQVPLSYRELTPLKGAESFPLWGGELPLIVILPVRPSHPKPIHDKP
jgi:hypothetical protein